MAFLAAAVLLALFVANVTVGSIQGTPWVGNVSEMLILLGASVAFVIGILQREARDKRQK